MADANYLQSKVAELNEKVKELEKKLTVAKLRQDSVERNIGKYEQLIERLRYFEKLDEELESRINKRITNALSKSEVLKTLNDTVKRAISSHYKQFQKLLDKATESLIDAKGHFVESKEQINMNRNYCNALFKKLIDNKLLSTQDAEYINKLATSSTPKQSRIKAK